jgi:hypothetical protein
MKEVDRVNRLYDDGFAFYEQVWLLGPETVKRARQMLADRTQQLLDAGKQVAIVPAWSYVNGRETDLLGWDIFYK